MTPIEVLKSVLVVLAWGLLAFILPRELKRRGLWEHYRQWVMSSRAYWGRASDKWVINDLVFYTDEFWGDVWGAIFVGIGSTIAVGFLILWLDIYRSEELLKLLVGNVIATPLILFSAVQIDRVSLARAAIELGRALTPTLDPDAEMKKMMAERPHFIRRVRGRYAKPVGA